MCELGQKSGSSSPAWSIAWSEDGNQKPPGAGGRSFDRSAEVYGGAMESQRWQR